MSIHSVRAFTSTQQAVERTLFTHPATVYNSAACQSTRPRACKCQIALPIQQSSAHVSMAAWPRSHASSPGCVFVLRSMHRHASAATLAVELDVAPAFWPSLVPCSPLCQGWTNHGHACLQGAPRVKLAGLAHPASGSQGRRNWAATLKELAAEEAQPATARPAHAGARFMPREH